MPKCMGLKKEAIYTVVYRKYLLKCYAQSSGLNDVFFRRDEVNALYNNPRTSLKVLPLDGECLGGGDHPPLNPLPSREGKRVARQPLNPRPQTFEGSSAGGD